MQLSYIFSFALSFTLAVAVALPIVADLTWSDYYATSSNSVNYIACGTTFSDKGIKTLGKIPGWPYVGAVPVVTGSGDSDCGACFKVTYTHSHAQPKSIYITAIDNGQGKIIVSEDVMNEVTGGQAWRGTIGVTYQAADASNCA